MVRVDAERIFDEAGCLLRNIYPHIFSRDPKLYSKRKLEWIEFTKHNSVIFEALEGNAKELKPLLKGVLIGWVVASDGYMRRDLKQA